MGQKQVKDVKADEEIITTKIPQSETVVTEAKKVVDEVLSGDENVTKTLENLKIDEESVKDETKQTTDIETKVEEQLQADEEKLADVTPDQDKDNTVEAPAEGEENTKADPEKANDVPQTETTATSNDCEKTGECKCNPCNCNPCSCVKTDVTKETSQTDDKTMGNGTPTIVINDSVNCGETVAVN